MKPYIFPIVWLSLFRRASIMTMNNSFILHFTHLEVIEHNEREYGLS